MPQPSLKGSH